MDDGGGQRELLAHAVRKVCDELFAFVGKPHELQQLGCAGLCGGTVEAIHAAYKQQVLGRCKSAKQGHPFRHNAHLALYRNGIGEQVGAEDANATRAWSQEASEHFDGGGLACAVRSEEAEELPASHGKVDSIDRLKAMK